MAVYVDNLRRHPTAIRCFRMGSCHMVADTEIELHAMANRLGMTKDWFQTDREDFLHYDLTRTRRARAVQLGAVERDPVSCRHKQQDDGIPFDPAWCTTCPFFFSVCGPLC